jgi:hypothetical protein
MPSINVAARTVAWQHIATFCREHPGEWALVSDDIHHSTAVQIKQGRMIAFRPAGDFEAIIRGSKNERGSLYVRYNPTANPGRIPHV